MHRAFGICTLLTLFLFSCSPSGPDLAVTQTGNPTKLSLRVGIDTSAATSAMALGKSKAGPFVIDQAYVVIDRVELEPQEGEESIVFQRERPYVVELIGGAGVIDSTEVIGTNLYTVVKLTFTPLSPEQSGTWSEDSLLPTNSVVVRGHAAEAPDDEFVFTSALTGEYTYTLSAPLPIDTTAQTGIDIRLQIDNWFIDKEGTPLTPEDDLNQPTIEENILASVSAEEGDSNEAEQEN